MVKVLVKALTSTEKPPASKKVVVMKEDIFHLIPYEEPPSEHKGWGAEEAATKAELEKTGAGEQ